jgi:diguanylate cyclase (GGDEF)-like protein
MFDADYLKQVNDTFGHTVGDKILMEIGRVASAQIRAVDVLARYGGDEFILLLPQTNTQQALLIAERICKSAEELRVSTSKGDATVTLSIGVADLLCAPTNESIERVIQCADKALYTAKQAGRNRAVMFELEYH